MAGLDLRANSYENNVEAALDQYNYIGILEVSAGDPVSDDSADENGSAAYGEVKYRLLQSLVVTQNGRYDRINYDYHSKISDLELDKDYHVSSWRLGSNYSLLGNRDIYANLSTGFRAPSIRQLFAGDIRPDGVTASNPDLEPDHAIDLEIGFRTKTTLLGADADLDLAIFQIDRKDYIMSASGQYGGSDDTTTYYDNIGGIRNRGLELALSSLYSHKLFWNLAYNYLDTKYTDYDNFNLLLGNRYSDLADCSVLNPANFYCVEHYNNEGNRVPRTPEHHLNLSLTYKLASSWIITGEMDAISFYYADEINQVKIDGHETFNLLVNYDRAFGKSNWSFFSRVDNLFDEQYYNIARGGTGDGKTVDSDGDGVYDSYDENDLSIVVNQGRSFKAGLSATF
jgi:iron complex outermembrane receptor protein